MNVICTFKDGAKVPLHEIEKLVRSGQVVARKLDGTPFDFPAPVRTKSSVAFEKPSPYETNGKTEKARQHKIPKPSSPWLLREGSPIGRTCALCSDRIAYNRHHLVPRSKAHIRPDQHGRIWTCRQCHVEVHWYFTNQELALEFWQTPKLKEELERRRAVKA